MDTFDKLIDQILMEFNVEDRNDPAFYDYAVIFVQQLKQRNLILPGTDVRKTAMQIVKDQYYNYIDINDNVSYKVSFFFNKSLKDYSPHNLKIEVENLLKNDEPVKTFENTHEEESIDEIVNFLNTASKETEQENNKVPGEDVPKEVSDLGSEMPGAKASQFDQGAAPGFSTPQQQPNTSQYLKGL